MASSAESGLASGQLPPPSLQASAPVKLPRIAIQFCTQCKWMLRAAYYAQELMSTFGPALGEVALQPATGGVFTVTIETAAGSAGDTEGTTTTTTTTAGPPSLLWDRKTDGGFPETKELKRRVRDVIEPGRNLGHVDRDYGSIATATAKAPASASSQPAPALTTASAVTIPPASQQPEVVIGTEPENAGGDASSAVAVPVCEDCQ